MACPPPTASTLTRPGSLVAFRPTKDRLIRLSTLGSVDLRAPDTRVLDGVLAQPKRLALLAYLAAARPTGFHRRDRLVAMFWPELDDARARDALSQALRFLRQALGANAVVSRGVDEVGVDRERVWCDAVAFRAAIEHGRADDALRLYRGGFLDGVFVEEALEFEEWVESERAALRALAARAARELAEQHDHGGEHTLAVGWGRRAVELAPDDERAFRRLLGFLDRAGDRAGALQAYDDFTRRLRVEYGAEPAAATQAMADAIRRAPGVPGVIGATGPERAPLPRSPAALEPHREPNAEHGDALLSVGASLAGGAYVIEGTLGAGGMATVYLAHDVRHDRRVAVKVLKPEIAATIGAKALLREIRIAASLQHPHIVPLFDSGESDGHVYYVMPHIAGESLRARLRREPPMPVETALRIVWDVADALAYAHRQAIVHRDIKPDNILLSGDPETGELHALVADFGVAKAIDGSRTSAAGVGTLTAQGGFVGTPGYMAPEQVAGGRVDSRADVYAWGVVAYELFAGVHPFRDGDREPSDPQSPRADRSPAGIRTDVPVAVADVVRRCLQADPSARPRDGQQLIDAIRRASSPPVLGGTGAGWWPARLGLVLGIALVSVGAYWLVQRALGDGNARTRSGAAAVDAAMPLDTSRYAILPFVYDSGVATDLNEAERLRDAFSRWSGVSLVDEFQLRETMSRQPPGPIATGETRRIAAELGAGRYVRGEVQGFGTSVRLHAAVYDTRTNVSVRDTTVRYRAGDIDTDSLFVRIADHLLFGSERRSAAVGARIGTQSLPARQAFVAAQTALERWDLAAADSQFFAAARYDAGYVQAWLWLAQVRWWRQAPTAEWKEAAERALEGQQRLSPRDRQLASALVSLARGDLVHACALFSSLARNDQYDFAAWYSTSDCLARDDAVLRDPTSRSGWRYRTSYHQSIVAYRRAVQLLPSIHRALRASAFASVRMRLRTAGNATRQGRGTGPEAAQFAAYPAWDGDSLAFVPFSLDRFSKGDPAIIPPTHADAVLRQRRLFHEIAASWAATFPDSPDAHEALAIALQLLGDPAALDTVRRARRLASDRNDRVRLATLEVWTRFRFALPSDVAQLRAARELADSLLRATHEDSVDDVRALVSLAALTGRATKAARLSRHRSVRDAWSVPSALGDAAPQLWIFASFGGPTDSLAAVESRFERLRRTRLAAGDAADALDAWLMRASLLAFPEHQLAALRDSQPPSVYYLRTMVRALVTGDSATARRILSDIARVRLRTQPADRAIDALYTEARVLESLGDRSAAAAWLDPFLDAIVGADPLLLADPVRAAVLMRAIALRADLASALGDATVARRWGTVVALYWKDADAFLQPAVNRMLHHAAESSAVER